MGSAIQRDMRKRIGRALELLDTGVDGATGERIHEARKQLKQVRALLHLIRPAAGRKRCDRADRRLRKIMHALSGARDATILLETFLQFAPGARLMPASLARFRLTLAHHRNVAHQSAMGSSSDRKHLREALRKVRKDVAGWPTIKENWDAIRPGLGEIYRSAAAAAAVIATGDEHDDEALHETRKRTKDLLHALQFLEPTGSPAPGDGIRGLRELTESLGLDHDLAVLEAVLDGPLRRQLMRDEARRLRQIVTARRVLLQRRASAACETLYASDDAAFVKEVHRSWKRSRGRKEDPSQLPSHARSAYVNARIFSGLRTRHAVPGAAWERHAGNHL